MIYLFIVLFIHIKGSYSEIEDDLSQYLDRFSQLSTNLGLNCGPVLNWFELDNKGNHTFISDVMSIID